jgi:Ca-activated chloride channel family protein
VGIGSAPAEGVLKRLAEASGGACEFVAPNEDAEGAILRMFARLRAPRVERAEVAWPATVAWTTPLPGGLFGGETIHAFAGFAAAPSGDVALKLIARGDAKSLTASAALPATVVEDRTLARVAASRRIESASEAEQLKLALDYGLLTSRTNLLVVHERAEGEKAKDLPELARVAQMHAAGWHGIGSALGMSVSVASIARFAAPIEFDMLDAPADLMESRHVPFPVPEPSSAGVGIFLVKLARLSPNRLPRSIADLAHSGLPEDLVDGLRALVAEGNSETDVVRAFLDAVGELLAHGTINVKPSRQLARALRNQFGRPEECRELRDRVLVLVRDASGETREVRVIV